MSMDVYLRFFLYGFLTARAWAGPLSTASSAFLAPFLANQVPICAQSCLQTFVVDSFPSTVCSSPSIECLCTSDSESGFTIGEGALSCLVSDCQNWDRDEAVSAYDVCRNVDGSMPNTHTIITASQLTRTTVSHTTSTSTSASDSSQQSSRSTSAPSQRHVVSSSPTASASTSGSIGRSTASASSSSSSATKTPPTSSTADLPASAPPSPSATPVLTRPQVAGIVVASLGAAALAFGLCFLLFCCRRRKQARRLSGSSFGGGKAVESNADTTPDLAILAARDFGHDPEGKEVVSHDRAPSPPQLRIINPTSPDDGGWDQWRRNTAPHDIGLALAPGVLTPGHPSPKTPASHRTRNSQLLPDKPSYSLFPAPLRPSPHSRRMSQSLEAQLAARSLPATKPSSSQMSSPPRFPGTVDSSQATMQGESNSGSSSVPRPDVFPYMQAARAESGYRPYHPEPSTSDVTSGPPPAELTTLAPLRRPLPAHASPSARGIRLGRSIHDRHRNAAKDQTNSPSQALLKPSDTTTSSGTSRHNESESRPPTWFSTDTDTSFEDADEPVSALSPVKERSSPSDLKPGLPLPPNPRPRLPARGESLHARRRGDQSAEAASNHMHPPPVLQIVRDTAKKQILQSPVLSEPLASESPLLSSPRAIRDAAATPSPRMHRGAGMTPPPSGWPGVR